MTPTLIAASTTRQDDIVILRPHAGTFPGGDDVILLRLALSEVLRRGGDTLIIDCGAIASVADAGIALLAQVCEHAMRHGCRLLLCHLPEDDADHLRIRGLAGIVFADEERALRDVAAFRRAGLSRTPACCQISA